MRQIKAPGKTTEEQDKKIVSIVETMLDEIKQHGEQAVLDYAQKLDSWQDDVILSDEKKQDLIACVPKSQKDDIQFAHHQVKQFAQAQLDSISEFEIETHPGVKLGQRILPVQCAGCYIPGGRYAHTASAIMSVTTAKVAGVEHIVACSPPRGDSIAPSVAYAMDLAGADVIFELGGVQAVAAMAYGLFTGREADILVGPGNAFVAEAKRILFGHVGIDVFAGPTESAIIADDSSDPMTIAVDLASQAEHGTTSPVWLFTDSVILANKVAELMPKVCKDLPKDSVALEAWENYGEIILCDNKDEVVKVSDQYAAEHLQVITQDNEWYKQNLNNYGSLFIGEGSTVTHGDKCSGTNHILPTKRAARYSGGLNVHKFLKILTYQELDEDANKVFSAAASRISRIEGMEGHARACDWRLRKYYPDEQWDFEVYDQRRYD